VPLLLGELEQRTVSQCQHERERRLSHVASAGRGAAVHHLDAFPAPQRRRCKPATVVGVARQAPSERRPQWGDVAGTHGAHLDDRLGGPLPVGVEHEVAVTLVLWTRRVEQRGGHGGLTVPQRVGAGQPKVRDAQRPVLLTGAVSHSYLRILRPTSVPEA